MDYWIEQVINGLGQVGPIMLIALSLSVLLSSLLVLNVSVGVIFACAALSGIWGADHYGVAGFIVASMVVAIVLSLAVEILVLRPQRIRGVDVQLGSFVATLGVSLIVTSLLVGQTAGQSEALGPGFLRLDRYANVAGVHINLLRVGTFVIALLLTVGLAQFLTRSRYGTLLRAVAADRNLARSVGIDVSRVALVAWTVAGCLTGIGAIMILLNARAVSGSSGGAYLLVPFAAVIAGGMGSLRGAFVAAMFFGLGSSLIGAAFSEPGYADAIVFGVLFILLIVRPNGVFASSTGWRDD